MQPTAADDRARIDMVQSNSAHKEPHDGCDRALKMR